MNYSTASPLISVIVPVYNVEKYLARCLDSIVEQTYQNLEIILVNDGSTDGSREICLQYGQRDSRIRLLDQENGGLSAARNTGLDNMRGEYVVFVDSDDYISPYMVETLLRQLLAQNVSIAVCNFLKVGDRDDDAQFDMVPTDGTCFCQRMSRNDVFDTMGTNRFMCFHPSWGKLYDKAIFESLRFDVGKIYEDAFIFHKIYAQAEWVCHVNLNLCAYRQSISSITRENGATYYVTDVLMEAWLDRLAFFQQYGAEEYVQLTERQVFSVLAGCVSDGAPKGQKKQYLKEIEERVYQITGKRYSSWRWTLFKISPRAYRVIRECYLRVRELKYKKTT